MFYRYSNKDKKYTGYSKDNLDNLRTRTFVVLKRIAYNFFRFFIKICEKTRKDLKPYNNISNYNNIINKDYSYNPNKTEDNLKKVKPERKIRETEEKSKERFERIKLLRNSKSKSKSTSRTRSKSKHNRDKKHHTISKKKDNVQKDQILKVYLLHNLF